MSKAEHFPIVFEQLKGILRGYAPRLRVSAETPADYQLMAGHSEKWNKELFFGGVQIRKKYVSYHLFPVYMFPDLLEEVSPALRRRMQGKSCFAFKQLTDEERAELAELTRRGFERFVAEHYVNSEGTGDRLQGTAGGAAPDSAYSIAP